MIVCYGLVRFKFIVHIESLHCHNYLHQTNHNFTKLPKCLMFVRYRNKERKVFEKNLSIESCILSHFEKAEKYIHI